MTKIELTQANTRLATENVELRRLLSLAQQALRVAESALATPAPEQHSERYPLTDARGRRYRMDGRVKCFPPNH